MFESFCSTFGTQVSIIATYKDGEEGFRICAEKVRDAGLKGVFTDRSLHCAKSAEELQNEVRRLGGDPETPGSALGALRRRWLNVKAAITDKDEAAVLAECERGGDMAVVAYMNKLPAGVAVTLAAMITLTIGMLMTAMLVSALNTGRQSSVRSTRSPAPSRSCSCRNETAGRPGSSAPTMGEGDLDRRIDAQDRHELGALAVSFNEMAARLEAKISHLARHRDGSPLNAATARESDRPSQQVPSHRGRRRHRGR